MAATLGRLSVRYSIMDASRIDNKLGRMRPLLNPTVGLIVLLLLLAAYRLTLIDRGHFYWSDERCYLSTFAFMDNVMRWDWHEAINALFDARRSVPSARPGFVLASVPAVLAQLAINPLMDIGPESAHFYDIASAYNVIVTLAITLCVYALGRLWTQRAWYALLMALVYSLLTNANVWIRHMAPYSVSLLCFLLGLWAVSSKPKLGDSAMHRMFVAGALSAFGFACYPGHYAFVVINGVVALSYSGRRWKSGLFFSIGSLCVVGFFELAAQSVGRSYLHDLSALSRSVSMGDTKEGYVFLWNYLRDVEGVAGIMLLVLFAWFAMRTIHAGVSATTPPLRAATLAAIAGYLYHATMGVVFGSMVFYGRVAMIYLPILVIGAVLALIHIERTTWRRIGVCALITASIASFIPSAIAYGQVVYPAEFLTQTMASRDRKVTYPPNVLWGYVDGDLDGTLERIDPDLANVADSSPTGSAEYVLLASHRKANANNTRFISVNIKYQRYYRQRYDRFEPHSGYKLVAQAAHPESFPALGYEGRKPWERIRTRERHYSMRIYERIAEPQRLTSSSGM